MIKQLRKIEKIREELGSFLEITPDIAFRFNQAFDNFSLQVMKYRGYVKELRALSLTSEKGITLVEKMKVTLNEIAQIEGSILGRVRHELRVKGGSKLDEFEDFITQLENSL